jgi:hypothetical protein
MMAVFLAPGGSLMDSGFREALIYSATITLSGPANLIDAGPAQSTIIKQLATHHSCLIVGDLHY